MAIVFAFLLVGCKQEQKFDKNVWHKVPKQRYQQVSDLINSKILQNKNKKEVKTLLSSDCKYCDDRSNDWMYFLGEGRNDRDFKWEVLDIEFKDEKVFSVSIRK